jgi:hypothetical protein
VKEKQYQNIENFTCLKRMESRIKASAVKVKIRKMIALGIFLSNP